MRRMVLVLLLAAQGAAAQSMDEVEIRRVGVAPGIDMLMGRGGNIGVSSGSDGLLLIDDQFAPLGPKIRAALAKIAPGEVRFVLNTHWHGDHTGGNEGFGRTGSVIVAHDNVRVRMSTEQFSEAFDRRTPPSPAAALPVLTFDDQVSFHWNGDTIRARHLPAAHTDGDAIVYFEKANVLHAGDVFFNGSYPFVDLSSGGSFDGLLAAVDAALELSDGRTRIIPGHGTLASRADLARYRAVLGAARDRVAKLIAEGRSADQVVEARPLAEYDAEWGSGFIDPQAFLRTVYASLSTGPP